MQRRVGTIAIGAVATDAQEAPGAEDVHATLLMRLRIAAARSSAEQCGASQNTRPSLSTTSGEYNRSSSSCPAPHDGHAQRHTRYRAGSAVRMVLEHGHGHDSQWAAISSIAERFGMTAETLGKWVRQAEINGGKRLGVTSAEAERIKELERENGELRRANEILKAASAFFARELAPRSPKS
jgi:transposase